MNEKKLFYLALVFLFFLSGCPIEHPSRRINFFGWKPDGSGVIAIVNDFGMPDYACELIVFDVSGKEQKKFTLNNCIEGIYFSDKLRFAQDGKSFFAQIGDDIYLVDTDNGNQTLLIPQREYLTVSPSGKMLLTGQIRLGVPRDSDDFSIFRIDGSTVQPIGSRRFRAGAFIPDAIKAIFISDTQFAGCFSTVDRTCSLTFFDTTLGIQYSTNDNAGAFPIAFAPMTNELAYISDSSFWMYNITARVAKRIGLAPPQTYSLEVSPSSDFILFSFIPAVSTYYGNYYEPSTISLVNSSSGEQINLVDKMGTNGQLSPDGRSVLYFTHLNRDFQIHIDPVP